MNKNFKKNFTSIKYRGIKELDIIFERFVSKIEGEISNDELHGA